MGSIKDKIILNRKNKKKVRIIKELTKTRENVKQRYIRTIQKSNEYYLEALQEFQKGNREFAIQKMILKKNYDNQSIHSIILLIKIEHHLFLIQNKVNVNDIKDLIEMLRSISKEVEKNSQDLNDLNSTNETEIYVYISKELEKIMLGVDLPNLSEIFQSTLKGLNKIAQDLNPTNLEELAGVETNNIKDIEKIFENSSKELEKIAKDSNPFSSFKGDYLI